MVSIERTETLQVDVAIIGAGISGINAGYRVQSELPGYNYTIIESRNAMGGTWDLFRYPGIRSDSDLHTFGFPWRPWSAAKSIADGESIRDYIKECAEAYGIDRKIQYRHKMMGADWSSEHKNWTLIIDVDGQKKLLTARFIILGTGYYDYDEPLQAKIPGINKFQGTVIHPQFWPEDLDYTGKKVVIIGSGATAITLLPNLAEKAAKVTMLQRSPSYVMAIPAVDPAGNFVRNWLPTWMAHPIVRWKFLVLPFIFFKFCRAFPKAARKIIQKNTEKYLPPSVPHDPNFKPAYNPWEQRLCVCPNGDFFNALQTGNCDVVTDTIKTVTANGIQTKSGKTIDADIIVTATGLKMQLAGGAQVSIDGKPLDVPSKFMWKGVMLQDMPNAAFVIGYTNASWTLGADATAQTVCRLLKHMDSQGVDSAVPRLPDGKKLKSVPILNLSSTYIEKAKGKLPKGGDVAPWRPRVNYLTDYWVSSYGDVTNSIEFGKVSKKFS